MFAHLGVFAHANGSSCFLCSSPQRGVRHEPGGVSPGKEIRPPFLHFGSQSTEGAAHCPHPIRALCRSPPMKWARVGCQWSAMRSIAQPLVPSPHELLPVLSFLPQYKGRPREIRIAAEIKRLPAFSLDTSTP